MAESQEAMRALREEEGGHAMTTEPEPERWATYQSAPPEEPEETETPEVAPGMDDASRWASGFEADQRGQFQDAAGVRAFTDAGKLLQQSFIAEAAAVEGAGDAGEEPSPEWINWARGEGAEAVGDALLVGGVVSPIAKHLFQLTKMGGAPITPATPWPRNIWRPTVNPRFPETVKLGRRYASGARGVVQRASPYAIRGATTAVKWAPLLPAFVGAWNFARGVKKIFDDDPARDMKDDSFLKLRGPIKPGTYNPGSPQMQYLRDNPDAAAALHAAGVLSTEMMDHLAAETKEE